MVVMLLLSTITQQEWTAFVGGRPKGQRIIVDDRVFRHGACCLMVMTNGWPRKESESSCHDPIHRQRIRGTTKVHDGNVENEGHCCCCYSCRGGGTGLVAVAFIVIIVFVAARAGTE